MSATGGITSEAVDAALPRKFFVMRGHVQAAFGLTRKEMDGLTVMATQALSKTQKRGLAESGKFVAEYPVDGRARFIRSQVLAVARQWEG